MRTVVFVIFFCIIIIFLFSFFSFLNKRDGILSGDRLYVGDAVVEIEIADSSAKLAQGLSGRESLGAQQGMLFVFPKAKRQSFWMKEMNFPLDMIFIDEERVVEIAEKVPAPKEGEDGRKIGVASKQLADMVLEVNSGWVEKNGVKVGDKVQLIKIKGD